ncbi:MAG TPA: right-handed parallel beta-helix repeat-containing protein [Planctomycetota bacterium]|nr:right-handed parallel beta-helix repeat-containing protein [Planctomycetota bacterium]HRR80429.1 right-handed parallel beta-helix repeat-containing protein [Planctomycetota bacterium]HRT94119.1 right-handed parallel beta-helix repeat-containing protein [Planctomycetota bacterium]
MPSHAAFSCRLWVLVLAAAGVAAAENASKPVKLTEELPTLKCLGVRWLVAGDDNRNAKVEVAFRKVGDTEWKKALDLFRVNPAGMRKAVQPPAGQFLFAGSIFGLDENTEYEVKLSLKDPDGGDAEQLLKMKTWAEPKLPVGGQRIEVKPGELEAAFKKARPGDILALKKGVYQGTFRPPDGEPGKPIALVGEDGAVFDAGGQANCIAAPGSHDIMLVGLAFRNAKWALNFNASARITVRRCLITDCEYGFVACGNAAQIERIYIADCTLKGPSTWPRSKGIEDARGIQLSGQGNVVCHNRISGYADAIDTFSTYPCAAIDFYRNEISECTDDGIEMDYSEHNTRCFENRLTNVFQGISVQPIHGGPVYIFRNALYNVGLETFKMHNAPSGGLLFHNTSVKEGMPLVLWTGQAVTNFVMRNNLFLGTSANYAYETTAPMKDCDFDYDGFGGEWKAFLKWNNVKYASIQEAREKCPVYRHAIAVTPDKAFASGLKPPADAKTQFDPNANDLRLREGSEAVDAGAVLPNINDGFAGKAPDLGAYELGAPLPHYGPRPERR